MHVKKTKMSAKNHALYLINRKEYGRQELIDNLLRKGHEEKDVLDAVNYLAEIGIQSDERASHSVVSLGQARKDGPRKILNKARQRKIDPTCLQSLEQALDDIDFNEQARQLVQRKYGQGPFDRDKQRKITNHLLGRGYTLEQAIGATRAKDFYDDED